MQEDLQELHNKLLCEWHCRRETVNRYSNALQRLDMHGRGVQERWAELNAKLSLAVLGLQHASDQLSACEAQHPY